MISDSHSTLRELTSFLSSPVHTALTARASPHLRAHLLVEAARRLEGREGGGARHRLLGTRRLKHDIAEGAAALDTRAGALAALRRRTHRLLELPQERPRAVRRGS